MFTLLPDLLTVYRLYTLFQSQGVYFGDADPASVKLLWQGCSWIYRQLKQFCKVRKLARLWSQFRQQRRQQRAYQLLKKPTQQRKRRKALVYLLAKLVDQLSMVEAR